MRFAVFRKKGSLLFGLLAGLLLLFSGCSSSSSSGTQTDSQEDGNGLDSSVTLTILEAGGESGEYFEEGFIKPFTEKTGIKVLRENPTELGKLQAMVESGQSTYNLVELSSGNVHQALSKGLIQEIDWDLVDPDPLNEEAMLPYAVGYQYYSTIMAWNEEGEELESWADFWDVERFPGKRSLPDFPVFSLPIALLADGVPKEELYPLDIDRAFESLEKIKDHVSVWWTSGSQPPQLLMDGEVAYAATWSGRVVGNNDNIGYTFNEGLLDLSYFVIPKGAKNLKETHALIHEMTLAENQARAAEVLPYSGPNKELTSLLPQDRLDDFPSSEANYDKQSLNDPQWWFENSKEVEERWQLFKLSIQ